MRKLHCLPILLCFIVAIPGRAQTGICTDYAPHKVHMIEVEDGVQLEVLDWESEGEVLVFLSGMGGTAHTFTEFIPHFWPAYRAISITRRGFGQSSHPESGYDSESRARDIVKILDHFDIAKATLIGHSIAGDELSQFGATYPERTKRLIYLDAYNYGGGVVMKLMGENPMPPSTIRPSAKDSLSIRHFQAFYARSTGVRPPLSELCSILELDAEGRVIGERRSIQTVMKILEGTHLADFDKIVAPTLAVFAVGADRDRRVPDYMDRDEETKAQIDKALEAGVAFQQDQIEQYRSGLANVKIVEIPNANHNVFISNESRVVREILEFLNE